MAVCFQKVHYVSISHTVPYKHSSCKLCVVETQLGPTVHNKWGVLVLLADIRSFDRCEFGGKRKYVYYMSEIIGLHVCVNCIAHCLQQKTRKFHSTNDFSFSRCGDAHLPLSMTSETKQHTKRNNSNVSNGFI